MISRGHFPANLLHHLPILTLCRALHLDILPPLSWELAYIAITTLPLLFFGTGRPLRRSCWTVFCRYEKNLISWTEPTLDVCLSATIYLSNALNAKATLHRAPRYKHEIWLVCKYNYPGLATRTVAALLLVCCSVERKQDKDRLADVVQAWVNLDTVFLSMCRVDLIWWVYFPSSDRSSGL